MLINDVYDIIGPHGPIPNGYNPNHYDLLVKHDFELTGEFFQDYDEKYNSLKVNNPRLLDGLFEKKICISDLNFNNDNTIGNPAEIYLYTICSFSNIFSTLGMKNYVGSAFENISEKTLKLLSADNFYIIIEYQMEGYNDINIIDKLYFECKKYKINPSSLIFITSTLNIENIHKKYLKNFPQENELNVTLFNWAIPFKNFELNNVLYDKKTFEKYKKSTISVEGDLLKDKEYKCLLLNRRLRFHRVLLLALLENDGLLNESLVSYDMKLNLFPDFIEMLDDHHFKKQKIFYNEKYKEIAKEGYDKLTKINKKTVDYIDIENLEGYGWETKEIYNKTFFSIVTETEFQDDIWFISEKTIKPIMQYHPFVLVGSPYTLKELKSYGFKTFSDFWDESYDEMESPNDRMIAIFELCKDLISKPKKEWDIMYKKMIPILKHNRNLLLKYDEYNVKEKVKENLTTLLNNSNLNYIKLF